MLACSQQSIELAYDRAENKICDAGKASGSPVLLLFGPQLLREGSSRRPSGWWQLQDEMLKIGSSAQGPLNMKIIIKATMYRHDCKLFLPVSW